MIRRLLPTCIAVFAAVTVSAATPQLNKVTPRGGQRGTEVDVAFIGARLKDAQEVLFYDPGITVTDLKATNTDVATAHLKISADAPLGEYRLRLRCATGISELRTFWVGPFPTTQAWAPAQKKPRQKGQPEGIVPNTAWEDPQPLTMNSTVEGVIQNEQVHYYKIDVKKGQRLSAEVEGMRLGTTMFDPYLSLDDTNKFVIASCDDTPLLRQDPYLSLIAPKDGTLILEVRDSAFGGDGNSHYRMHVGTFPRPSLCFPLGGQAGKSLNVQFLGDPKGSTTQPITLPNEPNEMLSLYVDDHGERPPSPNFIRVSSFPDVTEKVSDNNHDLQNALSPAIEPPIAFNGIIAKLNGVDFFRFKGHKGQPVEISVFARRLKSPLDSLITVFGPQNQYLAANDDANGNPDSALRLNPPADGDYVVAIQDALHGGGAMHAYRIEVVPAQNDIALSIPNATQVNGPTQERQAIPIPRGGRYATQFRFPHPNLSAELQVIAAQLPEGVTMTAVPTSADVTPVLFEAKADAPVAGRLCEFGVERLPGKDAKPGDKAEPVKSEVDQQVELVIGQPNNTPYSHTNVHQFAVAVTKESPYSIEVVEPKAPLVQGGQIKVHVKAKRAADFKGPITLRMLFDPPGVNGQPVEIPADKTEVDYPLSCNDGAPTKKWKIGLIGESNVDGPLWTATNLVDVTVAEPYMTGKIQMTAAEQGAAAQVVCDLTQANKFDGKAKVQLVGLPPNSTAELKEVSSDDKRVVFDLVTTAKTNPGQTTGLFVQATLQKDGEEIVSNFARGGVVRIDPAKTKADPKPQVAAAPKAPDDKPLSRLDKLRQEQDAAKK